MYLTVKLPPELPLQEVAAIVGDGVKAYTALHYQAGVTSGDTVLIMNGASSFGALCIQLAQLWGAKVCSLYYPVENIYRILPNTRAGANTKKSRGARVFRSNYI